MQSDPDLFPGIKLFFQLGNFFIMDTETLAGNSFLETHQAAISEVLKKNSLTERDTSTKNRVCENHYIMVRTGLDKQRARQLRQLLDHSYTLRHEATLLRLERQRQAIEVQTCLQPDAHWKYEDIRLRSRERHVGVHLAPCYLDKRQQFPVRLRSTKDNSLAPIVRRARARLRQHQQLEDRQRSNPSTSRSTTPHGAQCTPAPLAAASPRLQPHGAQCTPAPLAAVSPRLQQRGVPRLATVSAVSEPARRSRPGIYSTPTGLPDASSFLANPAMPALHNHTNSFHYNRTQSSINNDTKYPFDHQRHSSVSYYTIHSLDKHPHSSPSNHTSSIPNRTHSSLPNHTYPFLPNHTTSSLSNPITLSLDNHTSPYSHNHTSPFTHDHTSPSSHDHTRPSFHNHTSPSSHNHTSPSSHNHTIPSHHDHTQHKLDSDITPRGRHSTNQMSNQMVSPVQEMGKPVGNSHIYDAGPDNTSTAGELSFPDDDNDDDDDDHNQPEYIDLQAHFYGHHTNTDLHGDVPGTKQTRTNQLLGRLRKQCQASPKLTATPRSQATDLQDKVNAFLKNLPPSENARSTIKVCQARLIRPSSPPTPNSRTMNKSTANDDPNDPARGTSELKPPTTPGLIQHNTAAEIDSCTPTEDTDQNRAEIKAGSTNNTPPRRSQYSWRDVQVPRREGHPGAVTAEDLVLQALTGIPIRNVFQTAVPLHTASRAMRRTATFKMHQIVERMVKGRTRYERHQVEQLKRQMTLELNGQAIAEEELVQQIAADDEPGNLS